MNYYSRLSPKGEKEILEEHLQKTATLSGDFCSEFTNKEIGELIGWLHDAGKMTDRFQKVLNREESNINHAVIGGIIGNTKGFYKMCGTDKQTMDIITDIIISHHSEIKQNDGDKKANDWQDTIYGKKYSVSTDEEFVKICIYYAEKMKQNTIKPLNYSIKSEGFNDNLQKMLFERMLLSCLVDADHSASASFLNEEYIDEMQISLDPNDCLHKLETYRNNLIGDSDQTTGINAIRNQVYKDCSICPTIIGNGGLFKLTAPTGSAKTLGMIKWALLCAEKYNKKRIFTVLPFLSIISQTVQIYENIFGKDNVLEDDSQVEHFTEKERELANRWTSPIIVPTMVKFLESLFVSGAVSSRRLHNICNSVILFDEFQSIPPLLLNATLNTLRELARKYGCIILFSSASAPNFSARKGLEWWDEEVFEVISDVNDLYNKYSKAKQLNLKWELENKISIKKIANQVSKNNNSCCIVNTKKTAENIYNELTKIKNANDCFLITTNLCSQHRIDIIQEIKHRQKNNLPVYIVATQCIEAGVDISSKFMYREIAPLEAIIQSAGRCARSGECIGEMTIFVLDESTVPDVSYYNAKEQTRVLYEKSDKDININDLSYLNNYYRQLYTVSGFDKDIEKLTNAIYGTPNGNFNDTRDAYKIIDNNEQIRVVVPYGDSKEYNHFVDTYIENDGIVPIAMLKKIQKISVSTFDLNYKSYCKPVLIKTNHHPEGINGNMFLLLNDTIGVKYDNKIGLTKVEPISDDFIF